MKNYRGCNRAKRLMLHRRVECCPTCHNWDELDGWPGYGFRSPDGAVVRVCCEVADRLHGLGASYVGGAVWEAQDRQTG